MINDKSGPAFPCDSIVERNNAGHLQGHEISSPGMSMRDYFAAKALQGYMATEEPAKGLQYISMQENDMAIAQHCYAIADAMIAERSKG